MLCKSTMGVADYSKRQLKGSPFQEHRSKPHPSDYTLTCCNMQVLNSATALCWLLSPVIVM